MHKSYTLHRCVKPSPFNNGKDSNALEWFDGNLFDAAVTRYHEMVKDYPEEKFLLIEAILSEKTILGGE